MHRKTVAVMVSITNRTSRLAGVFGQKRYLAVNVYQWHSQPEAINIIAAVAVGLGFPVEFPGFYYKRSNKLSKESLQILI